MFPFFTAQLGDLISDFSEIMNILTELDWLYIVEVPHFSKEDLLGWNKYPTISEDENC
jgi:hypothetical protein